MDSLWSFIKMPPSSPRFLSLGDFSRLSAPRQAEWFDREFRDLHHDEIDVAALRLHLLGRVLHPNDLMLTNPLFRELADLIVEAAIGSGSDKGIVDVITTNVDCALEQNIAGAIERHSGLTDSGATGGAGKPAFSLQHAAIKSIVDFRLSARWEIAGAESGRELEIRLWKIHGCLRDLKIQMSADTEMTQAVLKLAGDSDIGLCGQVPTDRLAADLSGHWRQTYHPDRQTRPFSGVFAQSEYFRNLLLLARSDPAATEVVRPYAAEPDEQAYRLADFRELLATRPLIFVGYSVPEVDVDVVYALQQYRQRDDTVRRWQLLAQRERSPSADERLRQLGIDPWPFEVSAIGFASIPGKLRAARRHEWRPVSVDPITVTADKDWRRALERVAAQAWLEPQLQALRSLSRMRYPDHAGHPAPHGNRLVVAGLASIWHGIALTKSADFPVPRRVSAQLISVDAQVPGGSGLVPAMVAAAAAGPRAAGSIAFFSNAPADWTNWDEIEDMCLSAGIAVHPWTPDPEEDDVGLRAVARTSHVILFDPTREDAAPFLPRQRFIMDVQALTNGDLSPQVTDWPSLRVPTARPAAGFQDHGQEDFLFTDKEADPDIIRRWRGPTVYETGTSGDELVTRLQRAGVKPTIWTAGVGSFIRTVVALADQVPTEEAYASGVHAVLEYLEKDLRLAAFMKCDTARERYLAKLVSFGRRGIWDSGGIGFSYSEELTYGVWLREHWAELEAPAWELLGDRTRGVLAEPHPRIGGGALTTIHDGGLMAFWRWPDGRTERVAIQIETLVQDEDSSSINVRCSVAEDRAADDSSPSELPEPILIRVTNTQMALSVGDHEEVLRPGAPIRRNTLAAGDAVRGAIAFGLWHAAYRLPQDQPVDLQRILLSSAALASLKCYAGSFVDFLKVIEQLRGTRTWSAIWSL